MTALSDDVTSSYLRRSPSTSEAALQDPVLSCQVKWLRQVLHLLDLTLDDEGVDAEVRGRVLRTCLYGTVMDPSEAAERQQLIRDCASSTDLYTLLSQPAQS